MKKNLLLVILFLGVLFPLVLFAQTSATTDIVAPLDSNQFCGTSTNGYCEDNSYCVTDGCSGQICRSVKEEPLTTTCEWRDCFSSKNYGMSCGCVEGKCQWFQGTQQCTGEGQKMPVYPGYNCCSGLTAISIATPAGDMCSTSVGAVICSNCGNGKCEQWENNCSCPADCPPNLCTNPVCTLYCQYGYKTDSNGCKICACIEPPAKGTLLLYALDEQGNPISADLVALIYNSQNNAVEKLLVSYGKAKAELSEGSYTVVVSDYSNSYEPAKANFSIYAGKTETVKVIMKKYSAIVCGNGICESGEDYYNCPADCPKPCICPTIYAPVCGVDGKTYSNSCAAACAGVEVAYEGECKSETIKIELGQEFKLQEKQTAMLLENNNYTGIDLTLARVNYSKCDPGMECITVYMPLSVEVEAKQTVGNGIAATKIYLGPGQSQKVFGITVSCLGISQSSAAFVAKKETEPGYITVRLGEKFNVLEQQTALIQKNSETVIKLKFEGLMVTTGCSGSTTKPISSTATSSSTAPSAGGSGGGSTTTGCVYPSSRYAQFNLSFATDGVQYVTLAEGQTTEINSYKIHLGYLTYSNGKYSATMDVQESYNPDIVIAYLGVPFNLIQNQKAIVKETSLQLKLVELSGNVAVLEVLQPIMPTPVSSSTAVPSSSTTAGSKGVSSSSTVVARTAEVQPAATQVTAAQKAQIVESVKVSTAQGNIVYNPYVKIAVGEKQIVYGHTIKFNSIAAVNCISGSNCLGGDIANFTVYKETEPGIKTVYLDEKFDLVQNQQAIVLDMIRNTPEARAPQEAMRVNLLGIAYPGCVKPISDSNVEGEIVCDSRPVAKVSAELPITNCSTGSETCEAVATVWTMRAGEERAIGNLVVRLLDISQNRAWFIVRKSAQVPDIIKVNLDQKFDLKQKQTAFVVEESLYVKLESVEVLKCATSETKCIGGSYASVSVWKEYYEKDLNNVPVSLYKIKEGESLSLYGVKISLLGLDSSTATFIVSKGTEQIINVHADEPFKLKLRQAARVLEANMRIDLLNITQQKGCTTDSNALGTKLCKIGPSMVEISVSNYLFSKETTGTAVKSSDYIQNVIGQASSQSAGSSASGAVKIVEMPVPPMPFSTYTLSEGQSVEVNDFAIKVLGISYESAEFIVTKKGSSEKIFIELVNGWNLFSLPGKLDILESKECDSANLKIFEYIEEEKRFVSVTSGKEGQAYWVHNPSNACSVKAIVREAVPMSQIEPMLVGWNFVPVTVDMIGKKMRDIGSECGLNAAYFYNANSKKWQNAMDKDISATDLGKAFALYATKACSLGGNTIEPPMPTLPGGG